MNGTQPLDIDFGTGARSTVDTSAPSSAPDAAALEAEAYMNLLLNNASQARQPAAQQPANPAQPPMYQQPANPAQQQSTHAANTGLFGGFDNIDASHGLKPEELAAYGKALPVIGAVVRTYLASAEQNLRRKYDEQEAVLKGLATDNEAMFEAAVMSKIPDLTALQQNPNFAHWLEQPVPYTGKNARALLTDAYMRRDVASIDAILGGMRDTYAKQQPAQQPQFSQQPTTSTPYANAAPVGAGSRTGRVIPASAVTRATADFSAGKISLQVFNAMRAEFRKAESEGRLDANA